MALVFKVRGRIKDCRVLQPKLRKLESFIRVGEKERKERERVGNTGGRVKEKKLVSKKDIMFQGERGWIKRDIKERKRKRKMQ